MSQLSAVLQAEKTSNRWMSTRLCGVVLGLSAALAAVTILWLNRGTTFWNDEIMWFGAASQDLSILQPHNSHLIGTTRLLYQVATAVTGADYQIFRLLGAIGVLSAATLYYMWARRRLGPAWALLPAILLLFLGSGWQHVVGPIGFTVTSSIALGLAALIAVEGRGRGRDALTCLLLAASVFTYTVGLAYLVGVAIKVLLDRSRFRRIWIFLIPLLLYAIWYVWARKFDQSRTDAGNLLHVGEFFARSAAIDVGAITGVSIPFSRLGTDGFGSEASVTAASAGALGWIAAVIVVFGLLLRFRAGGVSRSVWASIGVLVTYWLAAALADIRINGASEVDAVRYVFPSTVGLLLVMADAAKGVSLRRTWGLALVAAFAFSLAMNLVLLRDGGAYLRAASLSTKAGMAMVELRAGLLPGQDAPGERTPDPGRIAATTSSGPGDVIFNPYVIGRYLDSVHEFGSPAFDLEEVRTLPATSRATADQDLLRVGSVAVFSDRPPPSGASCTRLQAPDAVPLSRRGGYFKPADGRQLILSLTRFGDPPGTPLSSQPAGQWAQVVPRPDAAPDVWRVTVSAGAAAVYCVTEVSRGGESRRSRSQ